MPKEMLTEEEIRERYENSINSGHRDPVVDEETLDTEEDYEKWKFDKFYDNKEDYFDPPFSPNDFTENMNDGEFEEDNEEEYDR